MTEEMEVQLVKMGMGTDRILLEKEGLK